MAVLVAALLVLLAGIIFYIYMNCHYKKRRRKNTKMRIRRTRGFGGSYRLLSNVDGDEAMGDERNSLL